MIINFVKGITYYNKFIKENIKSILLSIALCLFIAFLSIVSPTLISNIITYTVSKKYNKIINILILLVIVKIIYLLSTLIESKKFINIRKNYLHYLRKTIQESIMNLQYDAFQKEKKGKYIERLFNDSNKMVVNLASIKNYFIMFITNIGTILYIFRLDIISGIIYLISFSLLIGIRYYGVKKKNDYYNNYLKEKENNTSYITDIYNGIKDVNEFNLQDRIKNSVENKFYYMDEVQYRGYYILEMICRLSVVIEWIGIFGIVLYGVYAIDNNYLELSSFITIFMLRNNVFLFMDSVTDCLDQIEEFNISNNRILALIKNNKKDNKMNYDFNCNGIIEFKNVSFKYNKEIILKNCSFKIPRVGSYLIKGKSGSGKTTIFNLIMNLYKPNKGEILLDNININDIPNSVLRDNITIVSQNFYLFDTSIKNNLLLIKPNLTEEEMINVTKKVNIYDEINKMDKKFDTNVGEGGCNLSGGQREKIAIARALLVNSKIILFDEITNSLDDKSKRVIFKLINELKKDHTIIVISHNKEIMSQIKNVFILENGSIKG